MDQRIFEIRLSERGIEEWGIANTRHRFAGC